MTFRSKSWDRKLWGIEFRSGKTERRLLLGSLWDDKARQSEGYFGEPTHALLFCTRDQARAWCDVKNAEYLARLGDDIMRKWRVRPVRVREVVTIVGRA